MSILRRDPALLGNLNPLFDVDSMLNDFFYPVSTRQDSSGLAAPRIDIEDNGNSFVVTADLPGVNKKDIDISIDDGVLTLKASSNSESTDKKDGKIIRRERHRGEFLRRMSIGKDISPNDVTANFTDGVLSLNIPKMEPQAPKTHSITVS